MHLWPQVRPYAQPATGPRAQWPAGIAIAALSAAALLSACGGGACDGTEPCADETDASASAPQHPGTQPVDCATRPELCT